MTFCRICFCKKDTVTRVVNNRKCLPVFHRDNAVSTGLFKEVLLFLAISQTTSKIIRQPFTSSIAFYKEFSSIIRDYVLYMIVCRANLLFSKITQKKPNRFDCYFGNQRYSWSTKYCVGNGVPKQSSSSRHHDLKKQSKPTPLLQKLTAFYCFCSWRLFLPPPRKQ